MTCIHCDGWKCSRCSGVETASTLGSELVALKTERTAYRATLEVLRDSSIPRLGQWTFINDVLKQFPKEAP